MARSQEQAYSCVGAVGCLTFCIAPATGALLAHLASGNVLRGAGLGLLVGAALFALEVVLLRSLPRGVHHLRPAARPPRLTTSGVLLPDGQRMSHAEWEARELVRASPDDAGAHLALGSILGQEGRCNESLQELRTAVELTDDPLVRADAHNFMGNVYGSMERTDDAIHHYRESIGLHPGNPHAHLNLGKELDPDQEALQEYREALRLAPDYTEAHTAIGFSLVKQGREHEALPYIDRYVQLDPQGEHASFFRDVAEKLRAQALSLDGSESAEEVEARCREILKRDPRHVEARFKLRELRAASTGGSEEMARAEECYHRAVEQNWRGHSREAIRLYEEALRHDPEFFSAVFNLSCMYEKMGQDGKAASCKERALELEPGNWEVLTGLAAVYTDSLGRPQRSLELLERALSLRPDYPSAHFNMGIAHRAMGNLREAIACFERACALDPANRKYRQELRDAQAAGDADQLTWLLREHAAAQGQDSALAELLSVAPEQAHPLLQAAMKGDVASVRRLLQEGVDVDLTGPASISALHCAASEGYRAVAQALLDAGGCVDVKDAYGVTPLATAAWEGHGEVARCLLGYGADISASDTRGSTPLHSAAWQGHAEVVSLLLRRGADATARGQGGGTPLHSAAWNGHAHIADLLLQHGADVDARDDANRASPLYTGVARGHDDVVQVLLRHGADVSITARDGSTALRLADRAGHTAIADLLRAHGATV